MTDDAAQPYVLGTDQAELERLGFQHRLWVDTALALWQRVGLGPGQRVLDLGCGPGYATMDLAQLVCRGNQGQVVAIDEAPHFVKYAEAQAAVRGGAGVRALVADASRFVDSLPEDAREFEMAYARWVFCFLPEPEAAVRELARVVRPGGHVVIQDYFNYHAMTLVPRREVYARAVAATMESWRDRGGDPDIAGRLPAMLDRAGFDVEHVGMHQRCAFGHEPMYDWTDGWWRNFAPRLVELGKLSPADAKGLIAALDEVRATKTQYIVQPPVTDIVARRR